MPERTSVTRTQRTRSLGLLAGAGLACTVALTGCDRSDSASRTIREASIKLAALSPGAGPREWWEQKRLRVCREVISDLEGLPNAGPGEKAAAALLLVQAQMAVSEDPAMRALDGERSSLLAIARTRAILNEWLIYSAQADASEQYDPTVEVEGIDAQISDLQSRIEETTRARDEVDREVSALREEAVRRGDAARERRLIEAEIRNSALNTSAIEGARLIREAREHQRAADRLEVESSVLEAEAAKLEPGSGEYALEIEMLQEQTRLLGAAREDAHERAARARAHAATARESAQMHLAALESEVNDLMQLRNGDLVNDSDEATRGFSKAVRFARDAKSESRTLASVALGNANQSLADVHLTRAYGHESFADLMTTLAEAGLPDRSTYQSAGADARESMAASMSAAIDAYTSAESDYGGAGARGEIKERLDRIRRKLGDSVSDLSDGEIDLGVEIAADENRTAEIDRFDDEPIADIPGPETMLAEVAGLIASGDFDRLRSYYYTTDPSQDTVVNLSIQSAPASMRLAAAIRSQFGITMEEAESRMGPMAPPGMGESESFMLNFPVLSELDLSVATLESDGTSATGSIGAHTMRLRSNNGSWQFDMSGLQMTPETIQTLQTMAPMIDQMANGAVSAIEAGTFATFEDFVAMIQQASGGMPGGG